MAISKLTIIATLISLGLFLSACIEQKALSTTIIVTATAIKVSPTITLSVTPSLTPSPLPSSTPTIEPFTHQSKIEVVTNNAVTGDGGNSWGGHQTRIVHTKEGVFTAYTVAGNGDLNREWRLAERISDGSWIVIAEGKSGREPVNLLASPDGTLNLIGWPKGVATIWSGKPKDNTLAMTVSRIPNQLNGNWPYNSAGINANGDLCIVSSQGGEQPGGLFYLACYSQSKGKWETQTSSLDFRFCYTYVFPGPEGQLSLVSTRDVRWEALGYNKPAGAFDYIFNAFGFWRTDDVSKIPLKRAYFLEEKPTVRVPDVILNAQQDAYVDTKGQMHIIYRVHGASTNGEEISRHAIIAPDGKVRSDVPLPRVIGDYSRIFQDQEGQFFLLGSSGLLYPMGLEGIQTGEPILLNFGGDQVEYSGFGLSVPRTGTPLSNVMDVVYPSAGGSKWLYFQLDFSHR